MIKNSQFKCKLLLIDIDGTLVPSKYQLSDRVSNIIKTAKNKIIISLMSGRSWKTVKWYVKKLNLKTLHIVEAGSKIIDNKGNIKWIKYIDRKSIKKIEKITNDLNIHITYCINGVTKDKLSNNNQNKIVTRLTLNKIDKKLIKKINPLLLKISSISINKVQIDSNLYNLDITSNLAGKKEAVEQLVKMLNIKINDVAAIGNDFNDIEVLKIVGRSFSVSNAVSELKKISDYIVPSVEEDGVIDAIKLLDINKK